MNHSSTMDISSLASAEVVIHKVTDKEAVIDVTLGTHKNGNDEGDYEGSMGPKRRKWGGQYCSAVDCHSSTYRDGPLGVKFYRFPKDTVRRQGWIARVNRRESNGSLWCPGTNARLCSKHFVSGKSDDSQNPDYNPSIFPTSHIEPKKPTDIERFNRLKRRHDQAAKVSVKEEQAEVSDGDEEISFASLEDSDVLSGNSSDTADKAPIMLDCGTQTFRAHDPRSIGCQTERKRTVNRATNTAPIKKEKKSNALPILSFTDRQHVAFTGTHKTVFQFLLHRIGENIVDSPRSLKREEKLALVLVKLKMNVRFTNLAAMFDINMNLARSIFDQCLLALRWTVEGFIVWFEKNTIRARLPRAFKRHYPRTRAIIDCSEVECFTPNDPDLKVKLYSHYKSRYTMKFLVACAPTGEISFVSRMFGGRTTDTEITIKSGFINMVESGDDILGDKGFPEIDTSISQHGGLLIMPPFKRSGKGFQFTVKQTEDAYKIARVRIHVERCISRMKVFEILGYIHADMWEQIDDVLTTISGLCNLSNDLIRE